MSKWSVMMATLLFGLVLVFSTGCASTVRITSNPEGADVTVDGRYIGQTPTTYTDTAVILSTRQVRVEKPGYRTTETTISRDGDLNVGALVGGIVCLVPFLWLLDYPSVVTYELRPESRADGPEGLESFDWDLEEGPSVSMVGE